LGVGGDLGRRILALDHLVVLEHWSFPDFPDRLLM